MCSQFLSLMDLACLSLHKQVCRSVVTIISSDWFLADLANRDFSRHQRNHFCGNEVFRPISEKWQNAQQRREHAQQMQSAERWICPTSGQGCWWKNGVTITHTIYL